QDVMLQLLDCVGRRFRVRAPFDLEFEMMRRDAPALRVVAHALVKQTVHAFDQARGGKTRLRLKLAAEFAIHDRTDTVEHAPEQALDESFVAPCAARFLLCFIAHANLYVSG